MAGRREDRRKCHGMSCSVMRAGLRPGRSQGPHPPFGPWSRAPRPRACACIMRARPCPRARRRDRPPRRGCHEMSCFCRGGALRGLPPAVDPVLHRLRRRREPGSRIGSGMTTWPPAFAGVTKGARGRRWRGGGETVAKCHGMSWRGAAAGVGCGHLVSFRSGRAVPFAGVRARLRAGACFAPARARGGGRASPVGSAGLFSDPGEAAPDAPSLSCTILHFGQSQALFGTKSENIADFS